MKTKKDAYIYYLFRDNQCRAWFPKIRAILFVLLERKIKIPLEFDDFKMIKKAFDNVKQIRADIYNINKYRNERMRFEVKPTINLTKKKS